MYTEGIFFKTPDVYIKQILISLKNSRFVPALYIFVTYFEISKLASVVNLGENLAKSQFLQSMDRWSITNSVSDLEFKDWDTWTMDMAQEASLLKTKYYLGRSIFWWNVKTFRWNCLSWWSERRVIQNDLEKQLFRQAFIFKAKHAKRES